MTKKYERSQAFPIGINIAIDIFIGVFIDIIAVTLTNIAIHAISIVLINIRDHGFVVCNIEYTFFTYLLGFSFFLYQNALL